MSGAWLAVAGVVGSCTYSAWVWGTFFLTWCKWPALKWIYNELKWFAPAGLVVKHVTQAVENGDPWNVKRLGYTTFMLICWRIICHFHKDDDDDRWKRRRKAAASRIAQAAGGRLVVVPATAGREG